MVILTAHQWLGHGRCQDLREAKTELKREIRDREEGQSQAKMGGSGENHMGDFPLPA